MGDGERQVQKYKTPDPFSRSGSFASRMHGLCYIVRSGVSHRDDAHVGTVVFLFAEFHYAVSQSKQRVVFSDSHIGTGVVLRTALTNNDVASDASLTSENFNAQSFRVRFPSVFGATYTFFMSHGLKGFQRVSCEPRRLCFDVRDADFGQ